MSSLANHVYNGAPLDYQTRSGPVTSSAQSGTPAAVAKQANNDAHSKNFKLEISSASKSVSRSHLPVIAIPQRSDFRRTEYEAASDSPKRRKLQHNDREAQLALRQRTQKEQGDAAVLQFQDQIVNILEVRDQIEADNAQDAVVASNYFEPANDDDDFKIQFTPSYLPKLQARLKELIDLKRLDDISSDHITRLRQLCEGPVRRSQSSNLRLSRDPSDDDVAEWQSRIQSAEVGAASASVILLTALGDNPPELAPDVLQAVSVVLVNAFESCLIPVVEARPEGPSAQLFSYASANDKSLRSFLDVCKKLLDQLATACVQLKEAAECLNATEFLAAKLIFVQNGPTDKVAALGSKTFERHRKQVMSSLARLFAAFPADRAPIMDEILSSVDKLPSTSRSARQYPLGDGKSIMLVTALFVQLVQSSALGDSRQKSTRQTRPGKGILTDEEDEGTDDDEDDTHDAKSDDHDELSRLRRKKGELLFPAVKTAEEIVSYLVGKASKVSKSGDSPYRNILDLFLEDLVTLLPLPDWPATQAILERLCTRMIHMAQHEKAAGVKNMALESLGTMGAGIADARASAQAHAAALSRDLTEGSHIAYVLVGLANDHFSRGLSKEELLGLNGPFATTCLYYNVQDGKRGSKSLRGRSAQSFYLAQYAHFFCDYMQPEPGEETPQSTIVVAVDLLEEIETVAADVPSIGFTDHIQPREANLAYLLSALSGGFCRRYELIAQTLLASLSSEQAQVRARSLKSIVTILETDLSLLESQNMSIERYIFPCASDDSASVRDAALSLIAKFLISKPAYEERGIKQLIQCTGDGKVGVQKRSISHLAEIYAQDHRPALKTTIADTFLCRTSDFEESVSELAKRTLAEAWFTPYLAFAEEDSESAKASVSIEELTTHIANTLERNLSELPPMLTKFISGQLKVSKSSAQLGLLLTRIVDILFKQIIAGKATAASLRLLVCLAQARPESIVPTQLSHLRQYTRNLRPADDLTMFRAVIDVFRHVLPRLSMAHQDLLGDIQGDLGATVAKMPHRADLDNVMSCLRTIDDVLHNSVRFVKLLKSIMEQVGSSTMSDSQRRRLLFIVGSLAKHVDVDSLNVQGHIKVAPGESMSGQIANLLYPFAAQSESNDLQATALESLGCVCQAWPGQFEKKEVRELLLHCLDLPAGSKSRSIALRTFEELFVSLGDDSDEEQKEQQKTAPMQDLKKMGGNAKVQSNNSAIAGIAQAVFARVTKIALSTSGADLVLAARTVASMSRRGMFHPKDYAGVFVALETSEVAEVRAVAEQAHSKAHTQHESFWEREYIHAVQAAFQYQLQTAHDPSGIRQGRAKLSACFNIINLSGSKYVKKFLSNLISRLSVDTSKMDSKQTVPTPVLFVQFVVQNIAFFDFARMEDLLHGILQLELMFSKAGSEVSEMIETSLPSTAMAADSDAVDVNGNSLGMADADGATEQVSVPPAGAEEMETEQLHRLAAAACALTMVSEARSHLKRQYGISRDVRALLQQSKQAKEGGKAPLKVHGITGERFLNSTNNILQSMDTPEAMVHRCRSFHQLMSIDEDVVVGDGGDGGRDSQSASVDPDGYLAPPGSARGKKRKSTGSTGGTPRKRGRPRKNATPTRRSSSASSQHDADADYAG